MKHSVVYLSKNKLRQIFLIRNTLYSLRKHWYHQHTGSAICVWVCNKSFSKRVIKILVVESGILNIRVAVSDAKTRKWYCTPGGNMKTLENCNWKNTALQTLRFLLVALGYNDAITFNNITQIFCLAFKCLIN